MVKAVRALRMDDLLAGMIRPARFPELHFMPGVNYLGLSTSIILAGGSEA